MKTALPLAAALALLLSGQPIHAENTDQQGIPAHPTDTPSASKDLTNSPQGNIGVVLSKINEKTIIRFVCKESGALAAGLKRNDELLEVNGTNVSSTDLTEVFKMIKGEPDTTVKLTVLREGQNKLDVNVTRQLVDKATQSAHREEWMQWLGRPDKFAQYLGKPLPIKFTALDGREVDLAAMKGKVILIDFWATGCGPCCAEIPNMKAVYDKFHDQGFEIVGISFDTEKSKLERLIKKMEMPWPQYFDGKNSENQYQEQYEIYAIPTMWLIGKDGNVADLNARHGLAEKVQKLLEEK